MGEIAEAMIWAAENGRDPDDMTPEDWVDYYDDTSPAKPGDIAIQADVMVMQLGDHLDADEVERPDAYADLLKAMFGDALGELPEGAIEQFVSVLLLLAKQDKIDDALDVDDLVPL